MKMFAGRDRGGQALKRSQMCLRRQETGHRGGSKKAKIILTSLLINLKRTNLGISTSKTRPNIKRSSLELLTLSNYPKEYRKSNSKAKSTLVTASTRWISFTVLCFSLRVFSVIRFEFYNQSDNKIQYK